MCGISYQRWTLWLVVQYVIRLWERSGFESRIHLFLFYFTGKCTASGLTPLECFPSKAYWTATSILNHNEGEIDSELFIVILTECSTVAEFAASKYSCLWLKYVLQNKLLSPITQCGNLRSNLISPEGVTSLYITYTVNLEGSDGNTRRSNTTTAIVETVQLTTKTKYRFPRYINWVAYQVLQIKIKKSNAIQYWIIKQIKYFIMKHF